MSYTKRKNDAVRRALQTAWKVLAPAATAFPVGEIRALLGEVLGGDELEDLLDRADAASIAESNDGVEAVLDALGTDVRREEGIYLTPGDLAEILAAPVQMLAGGERVLDLSCGAGDLLVAAAKRAPGTVMVGVETQPALAVSAATRLVQLRREQGVTCADTIVIGDGLARSEALRPLEDGVGLVLGNPPYVREKGNRQRFQALRAQHTHLEAYWAGRMDLQYLFFHRSLDYLRPGGWLAFLTSAYWLTATNARTLRADLGARTTPRGILDVRDSGVFADAPGHHTLLTWLERGDSGATGFAATVDDAETIAQIDVRSALDGAPADDVWKPTATTDFSEVAWTPFLDEKTRAWGTRWSDEGTPLAELLTDRQGFVSGADTVNAWNEKRLDSATERGTPIFLYDGDAPGVLGREHGTVVRPVLRGSRLEPNTVWVVPPSDTWVLYIDEEVDAESEGALAALLGEFRPILEARREARTGAMPWYRLHWPRARSEQSGPKLVVPRRSDHAAFALDLSASSVSSDCTYLLAPEDVRDPLRYLVVLMVLLNRPETERYLREFGKTKGDTLEFYSEPLRRLPLPVRVEKGRLVLNRALLGEGCAGIERDIEEVLGDIA